MAKNSQEPTDAPSLIVPRSEAEAKIKSQIEKGRRIMALRILSEEDLAKARAQRAKWLDYNTELLTRLFDNRSIAEEYGQSFVAVIPRSFEYAITVFRNEMNYSITRLESILERLPLIPVVRQTKRLSDASLPNKNIFVVHGHDESAKESVARFIDKLGLRAIILQEQPKGGRTIIEQLEEHSDVGFAVVLMTPDDVGVSISETEEAKLRARQNVIFEFGYFLGKLERSKVRILRKGDVEIPSDLQGVLYIPMDSAGAWRMELAKEIKNAGIDVDLNKVFSP